MLTVKCPECGCDMEFIEEYGKYGEYDEYAPSKIGYWRCVNCDYCCDD